jgi:superfamily II DNA or RNA helicase
MRKIGDWAIDPIRNCRVRIIERTELWGYATCQVFDPAKKEVYAVPEERLIDHFEVVCHEDFIRFIAAHSKIRNELAEGILSQISGRILPLPHQLYALHRVLESNQIRFLFADEVGLGKTVEAGLVIKELKARALAKRILIVCPKGLVTQWCAEMKEKFDETFHIILPEDADTIRRLYGSGDVYSRFNQVICSLDAIKPLEKRSGWDREKIERYNKERIEAVLDAGWDLVIIDEAHRVAGSSQQVARYKLGAQLAKAAPYLLLLTATPHSGKSEPFLRLMRMLDEKAFPDARAIVKQQVAPYIVRTEKRSAVDHEGNRLFKDRVTKVMEIRWEERHSLQKKLYEMVTRYVRNGYNQALREKKTHIGFLMVLLQRLTTSSTAAIRESLERRIHILKNQDVQLVHSATENWFDLDSEEALEDAISLKSTDWRIELEELKRLHAVAKQAEFQYTDAKAEQLLTLLDRLRTEQSVGKAIIFTEFVATQQYLREFLEKQGFLVSLLNGSMNLEERNDVLKQFRHDTDILISTDAGGEGLNLQFCNVVINYDLPWNPMKIEQRIGRVDRIGQTKDVIVYNFILSDTVENRVRKVLEYKLNNIFLEMGINKLHDVLDSEMAEYDFTDVYIKSVTDPEAIETHVHRVENDILQQIKQALKIRDIVADERTFDTERAVQMARSGIADLTLRMVASYHRWNGREELPLLESLDLNDSEIRSLLAQDFYRNDQDPVITIYLPGLPNEPGFWSLWELVLTNDTRDRRIFPLFMNREGVFRPASARRIWNELLLPDREIGIGPMVQLTAEQETSLYAGARDVAHNLLIELKTGRERRIEEEQKKALFAMRLRLDSVEKIGLDTIKRKRKQELLAEEKRLKAEFAEKKILSPILKPVFVAYVE